MNPRINHTVRMYNYRDNQWFEKESKATSWKVMHVKIALPQTVRLTQYLPYILKLLLRFVAAGL
jgi:hypothetical protein